MGLIHRVLNITAGLAAGYLACKLLEDYNKDRPIEGEFLEVVPRPEPETAEGQGQTYVRVATEQDTPNQNPVALGAAEALQPDENGRIDATKIADSADFASWDELGCQS